MYCTNCGSQIPANKRYCTECGALNATPAPAPQAQSRPIVPPAPQVQPRPIVPPAPQAQPRPIAPPAPQAQPRPIAPPAMQAQPKPIPAPTPQEQPQPPVDSIPQKKKKEKEGKSGKKTKKKSGCLTAFLIFLAIVLAFGFLSASLLGKILPGGGEGNSVNQQVQPPYSEPTPSTPLRKSLGGSYTPDEKDFRFDESGSVFGYVDHVILVFFKPGVTDDEVQRVAALANGELIGCIDSIDCFELRVPVSGKENLDAVCETLLKEKSVIRACTDSVNLASSAEWNDPYLDDVVPNDTWGAWTWLPKNIRNLCFQQWSMLFPRGKNWHQEIIGAPSAWAYSGYYSPISVGILDGGFDTEHSDLSITVTDPYANSQTLDDKKLADSYNHGTHVAGIIGATRGNDNGINGILTGPYTLYGFCCENVANETSTTRLGCAMLLNQDCRVINRSLGYKWKKDGAINENGRPFNKETGEEYSDEIWEREGIEAAKDVLILLQAYGPEFLIVKSAGNDGIDAKYSGWVCAITRDCAIQAVKEMPGTGYTADDIMNSIIIVGAVAQNETYGDYSTSDSIVFTRDTHLELTDFSNFGNQVTICAPGDNIYSTVRGHYEPMSGTSMAAPIVAACAAQVWSIDLNQTPAQVKARLVSTATTGVETVSSFDQEGRTYSMVNMKNAVESLLLERGLISTTRPDGDLRRLIDEYIGKRIEEESPELERLGMQFATEFSNGDYNAAFRTVEEIMKTWFPLAVCAMVYLVAEIVLPGGAFTYLL